MACPDSSPVLDKFQSVIFSVPHTLRFRWPGTELVSGLRPEIGKK